MPSDAGSVPKIVAPLGAQALFRGLSAIEAIARGARSLRSIGDSIGCTPSTTHRLLGALILRGYVRRKGQGGYSLGPRLIELGSLASAQMPLVVAAHSHLQALNGETGDTVHLGVRDGNDVLYLDRIAGGRGLQISSHVGHRNPLACTGIGKALMLDMDETRWRELYQAAQESFKRSGRTPPTRPPWPRYLQRMRAYAARGYSFDLQENEVGIRCVAAPVRDVGGEIVASVSVASAVPYMPKERMLKLRGLVTVTAARISHELGWPGTRKRA